MSKTAKGDLLIVGLYVALTVVLMNFGYGEYQVRLADILIGLCLYDQRFISLLTMASLIASLIGICLGFDPFGFFDIFLSPLVMFISLTLMYRFRKIKYGYCSVALFIPVIAKGLILSAVSALLRGSLTDLPSVFVYAVLTEFVVVVVLGTLFVNDLKRLYERYYG